ncbi:PAS domain-containing protein [Streptomyces sp. NPDC060022]|uniref:PAS domain-containing protein n=1 Tax=Streptomyces sp. NPDC060022 TaxID=3347039 RepID=UPI003686FD44
MSRREDWVQFLDLLPVAWWETDRELRILRHGGGSAGDALGTMPSPSRVTQTERRDHLPVDDAPMLSRALAGETVQWQARCGERLLDVTAGPRLDAHGRAVGVAGVAVDVTVGVYERERQTAFASYVPAAGFIRDAAGRYLWANAAYAHLHGTDLEQLAGRSLEEVVRDRDVARARALDQHVLAQGRPLRHSMTFTRPNGDAVSVTGHRFPLETAAGSCVGGLYIDVTAQVRALEEKEAIEEELRALRDRTGAASVIFTPTGRVTRATAGAADLLHTTVASLEGLPLHDLVIPSPPTAALSREWQEVVRGRAHRRTMRLVCRTGRGGRRLIRAQLAVLRKGGRPVRVLALLSALGVEHQRPVKLTPIQEQVLLRLARGEHNAAIAQALAMSRQALDYHLRRLRHELDAPSRPAVVARAYALGLLDSTVWPPTLSRMS